jgi:tight adherence protein C
MTSAWWGALLGALIAAGALQVVARAMVVRKPQLAVRVLPYVRDLPQVGPAPQPTSAAPRSAVAGVFGPFLRSAAEGVETLLGGATSVRRRLDRAAIDKTVHDLRTEQVLWGLVGFAAAAAYCLLRTLGGSGSLMSSFFLCAIGFAGGVVARDNHLSSQVKQRERRILAEFPAIAELLSLAVAAGEGPVAALDRVCRRSRGDLSADLERVLAAVRTGEPVAHAFDALAARTGVPVVARFAEGVAVAVERGTPLADVLHAQAADVREAARRELIETAARKEVFMMVPVVFLVLPVTVLFAFFPGVIGLNLTIS